MCSWKRKGTPGSLIELNPVFNEIKKKGKLEKKS